MPNLPPGTVVERSGMAYPMFGGNNLDDLFTTAWVNSIGPIQRLEPVVDPKIKELEKKVEELDVINKLGVRWLRKKV